ncbi:MAG TPA: 23S rRNA (adenine(2030)-N(6))-methyltransferase RlmJ [Beijerinckiaceae bacterium]|nr:23S rRNA (adenine(2030)-N(6))-methyltransferase RlmJ [Beijerinckiaceae bacterium]
MNYRHAFHAGNFADVFKHAILARILVYLTRKEAPLRYLDTHAGVGLYGLGCGPAARTGEWHAGIGRLTRAQLTAPVAALLAPYLDVVGHLPNGEGAILYPGSPIIAQHLLRRQDRLIFCELHPEDAETLTDHVGRDGRAKVIHIDGYVALNAYLPPGERRGLVLIDPPFEIADEFERLEKGLVSAHAKWESGVYALWYPLKDPTAVEKFCARLASSRMRRQLRIEMRVGPVHPESPLAGCGMVVVNPPFVLEAEAAAILRELTPLLACGPGAAYRIHWLAGE